MPRLTLDSNEVPIPLHLKSGDDGVTGAVKADLTLTFFDGEGQVQEMDLAGATLAEVDDDEFPGRYLLRGYPVAADVDPDTETYITKRPGQVVVKWAAAGGFDAGELEMEVDASQGRIRDMNLLRLGMVLFDADQSRLIIHDEDGQPYKTILLRDKAGGDVVIEGTGPVSQEAAVAYVP